MRHALYAFPQQAWDRLVAQSGWKPEAKATDPAERLRAEQAERSPGSGRMEPNVPASEPYERAFLA
jgi:hypothetical protein